MKQLINETDERGNLLGGIKLLLSGSTAKTMDGRNWICLFFFCLFDFLFFFFS